MNADQILVFALAFLLIPGALLFTRIVLANGDEEQPELFGSRHDGR